MPGTDLVYAGTRAPRATCRCSVCAVRFWPSVCCDRMLAMTLRVQTARCSTDLAYGAAAARRCSVRYAVLT
eukprot:863270-Rhodomonas_salina.2